MINAVVRTRFRRLFEPRSRRAHLQRPYTTDLDLTVFCVPSGWSAGDFVRIPWLTALPVKCHHRRASPETRDRRLGGSMAGRGHISTGDPNGVTPTVVRRTQPGSVDAVKFEPKRVLP